MYFRKLFYITCIICLLSICVWVTLTHTYPDSDDTKWETAKQDLDIAYEDLDGLKTKFAEVRDAAQTLSKDWEKNRDEIRKGTSVTVSGAAGALIGMVATAYSGGAGAVVYLPSIFQGWLATKSGIKTTNEIKKGPAYAQAMSTAISALDAVLLEIDAAYAKYTDKYDVYLEIMASHDGGLTRRGEVRVYTKDEVYAAVNVRDAEGRHDHINAKTSGWYHPWANDDTPSAETPSQSVRVHRPKKHWGFEDITRSFTCLGDCGLTFDIPISSHALSPPVRCPQMRQFTHETTKEKKLFQCTVELDYSCDIHIHLFEPDSGYDDNEMSTPPGLSPDNGSYTASAGDTHEANLVTSEAYYYVYWYVASPSDSGLGTLVETDEGYSTGTETEASLSYTFASDAVSGAWTITAVSKRYSDLSQGSTRSYTVTVSSSSTGGSNSITYVCGVHSGPASEASSHAVQATCSETNANGDSCTVTGFYACQTHTHQFPDPNLCPAVGCNVRINTDNAADHALVTCTGNTGKSCRQEYYKCQAYNHRWVTCQRGVSCPSYTHGSGVNRSAYMTRACAPNPNTCITVNGQRQKHDLQ